MLPSVLINDSYCPIYFDVIHILTMIALFISAMIWHSQQAWVNDLFNAFIQLFFNIKTICTPLSATLVSKLDRTAGYFFRLKRISHKELMLQSARIKLMSTVPIMVEFDVDLQLVET